MSKSKTMSYPINCRKTLALGADVASSLCFTSDNTCRMLGPFGDLSYLENLDKYKTAISDLLKTQKPEQVVCDLHPGYHSVEYGKKLAERLLCKLIQVQHHKAHCAGVAAEHGLTDYVGIACDGLGYGEDGKLWGGEIFNNNERAGHLEEQNQLGGDSAAIYPKKMLFGILTKFMDRKELQQFFTKDEINVYSKQLQQKYNVFTTTSTGRVLDAVSALLGVCVKRTYEGEPAIKLEQSSCQNPYALQPKIETQKNKQILNTTYLFEYLVKNLDKDKKRLAATAQLYLVQGLYHIAVKFEKPIVFSGGVAKNKIISGFMNKKGVLLNKKISCGDAGLCLGQVYLANINDCAL